MFHSAARQTRALSLTPRELDLVMLAAQGLSGKQAASHLGLSPGTVRNYWGLITKRFDTTCAGVVALAFRRKWIE
jgi:DNA-binding CsgD family transcriptional regulator